MKGRIVHTAVFLSIVATWFTIAFAFLRVYELSTLVDAEGANRFETLGFLYDWPFACAVAILAACICILVALINTHAAKILSVVMYASILSISFLIVHYFSVTNVPLSADLFGYSLRDIRTTVSSSGGIGFGAILALALYLVFFISGAVFLPKYLTEKISIRLAAGIFVILFVISLIPAKPSPENFESDVHYNLVVNKPKYFFDKSVTYLRESAVNDIENFKIKPFPFYHPVANRDVLGKYFEFKNEKPNLVFLFVEGLGADFSGPNAKYGGFTPFLDSLATQSLYWRNALSNTGRTFGVLPSALGSLPYGKEGFLSYGVNMPDHQTLISLLKGQGYSANYFYGGNPNFDNQDIFLQYQGIDFFLNESNFPVSYKKAATNEEGFSWGYPDGEVLNYSLEVLLERGQSPRIDVYLTLTTHEPFISPDPTTDLIVENKIKSSTEPAQKQILERYAGIFSCLQYTDNALRSFFDEYKKRPEFGNTIFIITGDHRLIPVPQDSRISRFRVPLIMYSPMLNASKNFGSMVTHADLPSAILNLLSRNFEMKFPESLPFISEQLDTMLTFSSKLDLALMRNKGEVNDYISGKYFLSDNILYSIDTASSITRIENDSLQQKLKMKLKDFRIKGIIACSRNEVDKVGSGRRFKNFDLTEQEEKFVDELNLTSSTPDEIFSKAQELAFAHSYTESATVLRYLLNKVPNYHDARLLLGRTFAWQNQFDTARYFFQEVLTRSPAYEDGFVAFSDVEYWDGKVERSLEYVELGLKSNPNNIDLRSRHARALLALGKKADAIDVAQEVLLRDPKQEIALEVILKSKQ